MAFSKTLIPLFFLLLANKVASQRSTATFTYHSFNQTTNTLIYQGDAFVPPSSSFARLTRIGPSGQPAADSIGRLVYAEPINFWDEGLQASFVTTMNFVVRRGNTDSVADGFTFFIAPVNSSIPPGSSGGNFGLFDPATGRGDSVFAVEFDIFSNSWDPNFQHLGIDIESRKSANTSRFENSIGRMVTAQIRYVSWTRTISVVATYGSSTSKLTYAFDLKTILPKQVHVGISAATGSSVGFHDLHYWSFTSTLFRDGSNNRGKTYIAQYV